MIAFSAAILLTFTCIYIMPFMFFSVGGCTRPIGLFEALYYSGITFTTVGYGDIVPMGAARYLAMTEAFCGIVMSSGLAVSIARRYIE
jgi:hypothetical protein